MSAEGPPDEAYHLAGDRLGKFTILSELGRGSMGVVYEAFQEDLKRKVALKVLPANIALDKKQVERFRREAESAARLRHDNIIQIYEIGHAQNTHYFVMEVIDGGSMREHCKGRSDFVEEAARIGRDAARGLAHAHERGVIHRDIKPANVLVARDGRVAITDFGLARLTESMSLTSTDAIVGTPKYMSPEQILRGERNLDGRGDVYSLGAALYEVLTGRPPIEAPSVQAFIRAVLEERPPTPRKFNKQIPHDLATIVLRCLEKDAEDRYDGAGALADDLDRFLKGERIQAKPKGSLARSVEVMRRHRILTSMTAIVVLALITALAFATKSRKVQESADFTKMLAAVQAKVDTSLDDAAAEIDDLLIRYPGRADVRDVHEAIHGRRARFRLRHAQENEDFERALQDMRLAGAERDPFWFQMLLIETRLYDEARKEAAKPETPSSLRTLTLARLEVEENRDYRAALELLFSVEEERHFHHLTRGEAYYGLGIESAAKDKTMTETSFRYADTALRRAVEGTAGIEEEWLRVRSSWMYNEVRARLDPTTNLANALLGFGGTAQESLRRLTRFAAGESEEQRVNTIDFVRAVLALQKTPQPRPETLAAVLKDEADKRLQEAQAAGDPAEQVRAYLLQSVAFISAGALDDAIESLKTARGIEGIPDDLHAYVYWGRSLLERLRRNAYEPLAVTYGVLACRMAAQSGDFKDRQPLVQNVLLLAEEAKALNQESDVEKAANMLKAMTKKYTDLAGMCRKFLASVPTSPGAASGDE